MNAIDNTKLFFTGKKSLEISFTKIITTNSNYVAIIYSILKKCSFSGRNLVYEQVFKKKITCTQVNHLSHLS